MDFHGNTVAVFMNDLRLQGHALVVLQVRKLPREECVDLLHTLRRAIRIQGQPRELFNRIAEHGMDGRVDVEDSQVQAHSPDHVEGVVGQKAITILTLLQRLRRPPCRRDVLGYLDESHRPAALVEYRRSL